MPSSRESRLKQISEAVGLLAAVVATVYLLGAFVLALRLQTNDLPTLAVLSNLPRELVISVGLTYAVVPWLLAAASVALYWLLRDGKPVAPESERRVTPRELARALGLAVVAVAVAWLVLRSLDGRYTWLDAAALFIASTAVILVANVVWRLLSRRYGWTWTKTTAVSLAAMLTGLVTVPLFVAVGARWPLADAQLCGVGSTHLSGWLVGEAGDRVYIGENVDPHRIVSAPRTGELYVGPGATEALLCRESGCYCRPPTSSSQRRSARRPPGASRSSVSRPESPGSRGRSSTDGAKARRSTSSCCSVARTPAGVSSRFSPEP